MKHIMEKMTERIRGRFQYLDSRRSLQLTTMTMDCARDIWRLQRSVSAPVQVKYWTKKVTSECHRAREVHLNRHQWLIRAFERFLNVIRNINFKRLFV